MIRIAITVAAFDAIAATLPIGSVAVEPKANERGEREIWLEPHILTKLKACADLAEAKATRSCGWRPHIKKDWPRPR